jgi:hypothetical protein
MNPGDLNSWGSFNHMEFFCAITPLTKACYFCHVGSPKPYEKGLWKSVNLTIYKFLASQYAINRSLGNAILLDFNCWYFGSGGCEILPFELRDATSQSPSFDLPPESKTIWSWFCTKYRIPNQCAHFKTRSGEPCPENCCCSLADQECWMLICRSISESSESVDHSWSFSFFFPKACGFCALSLRQRFVTNTGYEWIERMGSHPIGFYIYTCKICSVSYLKWWNEDKSV